MFLVDSHCHLDGLDYESLHKDVDDVLAKAAARDVKFCLAVATTLPGYLHTVSYTHLDVYKRQIQLSKKRLLKLLRRWATTCGR